MNKFVKRDKYFRASNESVVDITEAERQAIELKEEAEAGDLEQGVRGCTEREQSKYRQWVRLSLNSIKSQEDS